MVPVYEDEKLKYIRGNAPGYGNYKIEISSEGKVEMTETSFAGTFDPVLFGEVYKENLFKNHGMGLSKNENLRDNERRSLWYFHFLFDESTTFKFRFIAEGDEVDSDVKSLVKSKKEEFQNNFKTAFDISDDVSWSFCFRVYSNDQILRVL